MSKTHLQRYTRLVVDFMEKDRELESDVVRGYKMYSSILRTQCCAELMRRGAAVYLKKFLRYIRFAIRGSAMIAFHLRSKKRFIGLRFKRVNRQMALLTDYLTGTILQ